MDCFVLGSYPSEESVSTILLRIVATKRTPVMGFYCNLITNYELIFTWAQGAKYAGFALFFVVVGFLSLKTYYFKFDKTTEP